MKKHHAAAAFLLGLSSCASIANLTGNDTHSLNLQSAQEYSQLVQKANAENAIVSSGPDYDLASKVLTRMEPYADQINQTGEPFQWQLTVFKSNEINAWVMPGGRVGVYTGLIDQLHLTEPEMAAVLGHEMTHALEEHAKQQAGAQILTNIATGVASTYTGGVYGDAISAASQLGVGLPYSRSLETRADLGGLMLMARSGYDPKAALSLWDKMAKFSGSGNAGGLAKYLSDHPNNAERTAAIQEAMPKAVALYNEFLQQHKN
ncbi:M48 family metallopeptidase [Swingsia samuiensis]|uniref:M48 family peptidase n=1 Tax=Swingsia samuiensis TaxID=1293412 RepID=A0A4Y6UGZ0_9PROT|nr:M48 family metallopeptidase [Swingsia samuiensis]QDH16839.1 M48 family peptidase [Swingsia samuiensis]